MQPAWEGVADCKHCAIRERVLFARVPDAELDQILVPIENRVYERKTAIYQAGDPGEALYTIRSGLAKLVHTLPNGSRRVVRLLQATDVLGLEALLGRQYEQTAVVLTRTDLCRIPIRAMHQLESRVPTLQYELYRRWQQNLDQANRFIVELSTGSAPVRISRLLLMLDDDSGTLNNHNFSREDMGEILGMSTETAARQIADMKRRGIIRESNSHLKVTDKEALQRIADG